MSEILSQILKPASAAFRLGTQLRNRAYDRGWIEIEDCGRPVISVGNLTTGGTGKTPFTKLLAERLRVSRARKLAIISRGYRSESENSVARVDTSSLTRAASKFGDEPAMLAHLLRDIPVFVGRRKVEVARQAVAEVAPDLIIADDAFQHRRLKRAFDFVLLDSTEPWWHFQSLPGGRLREPFTSLKRAQAIVLTKVNLADANKLSRIRDAARVNIDSSRMPVFIEVEYRIQRLSLLSDFLDGKAPTVNASDLKSESLFLFSAIARPAAFKQLIAAETGAKVVGSSELRDHASLAESDVTNAKAAAVREKASRLVVTEKDAVKLNPKFFKSDEMPLVSHLEAIPQNWNEIDERFSSLGL